MLYLIGLGLAWQDLSLKALEAISQCSEIYLETYTSIADFSSSRLSKLTGKKIIELDRKGVEEQRHFLKSSHLKDVALLVYGDPLSATTHIEILLEAQKKKIPVQVIHSSSVLTAVGQTGLFLYKFGKTVSIPKPEKNYSPESFFDILEQNNSIEAHTLFLLDLNLTLHKAIEMLLKIAEKRKSKLFTKDSPCIGCARLGQQAQKIKAGTAKELMKENWGSPPYCLIVPSKLHFIEEEAVKRWE